MKYEAIFIKNLARRLNGLRTFWIRLEPTRRVSSFVSFPRTGVSSVNLLPVKFRVFNNLNEAMKDGKAGILFLDRSRFRSV